MHTYIKYIWRHTRSAISGGGLLPNCLFYR